jgi:hypothetical protein
MGWGFKNVVNSVIDARDTVAEQAEEARRQAAALAAAVDEEARQKTAAAEAAIQKAAAEGAERARLEVAALAESIARKAAAEAERLRVIAAEADRLKSEISNAAKKAWKDTTTSIEKAGADAADAVTHVSETIKKEGKKLGGAASSVSKKLIKAAEKSANSVAKQAQRLEKQIKRREAELDHVARQHSKKIAATVRAAINRGQTSVNIELSRGAHFAKHRAEVLKQAVTHESATLFSLKNWRNWTENPAAVASQALSRGAKSINVEAKRASQYLKNQWWYGRLTAELEKLLIEKPVFHVCGASCPGTPVWYVNGILTTTKEALIAGHAISTQINRPVHLIHNPTFIEPPFQTGLDADGFGTDDLSECVYDRIWPVYVASRLYDIKESLLQSILDGGVRLQENPSTRQLAWVVAKSETPPSIITHSQGCIIARNAFLTASILSAEEKARSTAWVAAGIPLNNNEIWPKPRRTEVLDYSNDPVAKCVGLRGGGLKYSIPDHDFMVHYVDQLKDTFFHP